MANRPSPPSQHPSYTTPTDAPTPYDPTSSVLNSACLDFLLIELVPLAYRITADLAAREEAWVNGDGEGAGSGGGKDGIGGGNGGIGGERGGGGGGGTATLDEEEAREAVFHRLEMLGYRVGLGIVERYSRTSPRPTTPLDTIKFLCKDLWTLLFRKQIDNLKTNHRGIYVLTDNTFKPLSRMSFDVHPGRRPTSSGSTTGPTNSTSNNNSGGKTTAATTTITSLPEKDDSVAGGGSIGRDLNMASGGGAGLARAQPFLYFPAGVIRGSLAALGIQATVQAETSALPGATFQIRTVGAKP